MPTSSSKVTGTATGLYILLLVATLLLGTGEVLRDNCGQTFMPSIVEVDQLEKANGRMWSAEGIANTFIGPPLGSLLLLAAFSLPFFVDAASFFAAAALVCVDPRQLPRRASRRPRTGAVEAASSPKGFRWLWSNELLRSMAIILGLMNLASALSGSVLVLFAQEILHVGPLVFTIMGFGFAAGGAIGSNWRPGCRSGSAAAPAWRSTLGTSAAVSFVVGADVVVAAGDGAVRDRRDRRRDLERDHRQPAPGDHSASPARPGQQRLPLLRLGNDADRRGAGRHHGRRLSATSPTGGSRCDRRSSSTPRSTPACSSSVAAS